MFYVWNDSIAKQYIVNGIKHLNYLTMCYTSPPSHIAGCMGGWWWVRYLHMEGGMLQRQLSNVTNSNAIWCVDGYHDHTACLVVELVDICYGFGSLNASDPCLCHVIYEITQNSTRFQDVEDWSNDVSRFFKKLSHKYGMKF